MTRVHIRPADGLVVRDPVTREIIPVTGKTVDLDEQYWARRLRDKSILKGAKPTPAATPKAKAKETE